jgi:hypothetical protein
MYLAILILPFLGALTSGFFGRKIGVKGSHFITCTSILFSAILATVAFYEVGIGGSPVYINLFNWIETDYLTINWEFKFDQLTVSMFIPVLYISSLIHIFSTDYMGEDPHNQRFFAYLSLFTFFMLILVAGANFFVMFVGWEGKHHCLKWLLFVFKIYFEDLDNIIYSILFLKPSNNNSAHLIKGIRTFFIEGKINSYKRIGPHNLDILSMIIGTLLGDAHLEKRKGGIGTRLILEQNSRNVEYLMWFFNYFSLRGYCPSNKPKLFKRIKKNNTVYFGYRFKTYTFSSLNWLHNSFYPLVTEQKGVKRIPIQLLEQYLSPLSLAIWFSDAGSKFGQGYKIATSCFIREDLEELCLLLKRKYNLNCSLHKNKNYLSIYIKKSSAKVFTNLVNKYMVNSLKYKLGNHNH